MLRLNIFIVLILLSTVPTLAQVGGVSVPVNVTTPASQTGACNPAPGQVLPCYQAPPQTPVPATNTAPNVATPSTAIPQGVFATISTSLLNRIQSGVSGALNSSVIIGQWLLVRVAAISIIVSIIGWFLNGESIRDIIRILYWRIFETFAWLTLIAWTWNGPGGMPGWFPLIIGGIAATGASIANQVAGTPIATFANYRFDFTVLPGTILDLGAALFGAISTLAWDTFAGGGSTLPGPFGVVQQGAKTVVALVGGALTGTLFANGIIYLLMMLTAMYIYFVCAFIAWRYFLAVLRVFVLGCLSFLQGFAGSRRLSGYAGGFISIAIVLGSEFALTTILVGIFYGVIVGLIQSTAIWPQVSNIVAASGGVTVAPVAWAQNGISLGYLLLLDMITTIWAFSMYGVPKAVSDFFAGRLSVAPSETIRFAKSSPTIGGKLIGTAGSTVQAFAQRGPLQATSSKIAQIGSFGMVGASSKKRGTTAGMVDGAVRGGMLGGVTGAVAAAAGSWVAGRFIPTPQNDSTHTSNGRARAEKKPESTPQSDANASGIPAAHDADATAPSPKKPADATTDRTVTIKDTYDKENAEGENAHASSKKTTSSTETTVGTPIMEALKQWNAYKNPPDSEQEEMLREIEMNTRVGQMMARTLTYGHQYRVARGNNVPVHDEQSTALPQPRMHFGDKT
jgi:hypothetical protein